MTVTDYSGVQIRKIVVTVTDYSGMQMGKL